MVKGVPLKKESNLFDGLFVGSHKTHRVSEHLTEPETSNDNRDYELMRLRVIQEELERRMKKYEKTIDIYQYSLILVVILLLIKMIVDKK